MCVCVCFKGGAGKAVKDFAVLIPSEFVDRTEADFGFILAVKSSTFKEISSCTAHLSELLQQWDPYFPRTDFFLWNTFC